MTLAEFKAWMKEYEQAVKKLTNLNINAADLLEELNEKLDSVIEPTYLPSRTHERDIPGKQLEEAWPPISIPNITTGDTNSK